MIRDLCSFSGPLTARLWRWRELELDEAPECGPGVHGLELLECALALKTTSRFFMRA
jgi:hypothetical protein